MECVEVNLSCHGEWKKAFSGAPLRVGHKADARGLDLELKGPGPWQAQRKA